MQYIGFEPVGVGESPGIGGDHVVVREESEKRPGSNREELPFNW